MHIYCATSLLTIITCVCLAALVFFKNPKNSLHLSLVRLNLIVACWSFFLLLHYLSDTPASALFTARFLHVAAVFIPPSYLNFIVNLLRLNKKKVVLYSYIASFLLLILVPTTFFIKGVEGKLFFKFYAQAGNLYILWIIAYILISGYGIYLLLTSLSSVSSSNKNQIRYVLVASIIGLAGGATILPLFYNILIPPLGEHIIFLYPIIFTYAVLKHNLLDLNLVIRRTLVYSISLLLISLSYIVLILLSERLLQNAMGYNSLWITLWAAVLIAILFNPVKNRVQSLIDKFYVKSQYQRLQKELLESDKRKALVTLASGLAHEIRNPLTAIKTFAEYLPKKFDDADFREKFSRIVSQETTKINSLISQLLEFAKPSALSIAPCDMHELLEYTLNLLSAEMIKYNIRLVKDSTHKGAIVSADSNKIRQVFFNIIKNAIEAMPKGGTLRVTSHKVDKKLCVEIGDTGSGIKNKDLGRIFEPFYSTKDTGTGLGLAVVHSILKEHDATISAKSAPKSGTIFTIDFYSCPADTVVTPG
ncbi:ATP-binding protein [Candidatus Omnitrophota bacterium]